MDVETGEVGGSVHHPIQEITEIMSWKSHG